MPAGDKRSALSVKKQNAHLVFLIEKSNSFNFDKIFRKIISIFIYLNKFIIKLCSNVNLIIFFYRS